MEQRGDLSRYTTYAAVKYSEKKVSSEKLGGHIHNAVINSVIQGRVDNLKLLLTKGGDLHFISKDPRFLGWTLLHYAVSRGQFEMTRFLIESGVDVNSRNASGTSAFFNAAISFGNEYLDDIYPNQKYGIAMSLSYLVQKGATKNEVARVFDLSPLMVQALSGSLVGVKYLVSLGVNPAYKNHQGATAYDILSNLRILHSSGTRRFMAYSRLKKLGVEIKDATLLSKKFKWLFTKTEVEEFLRPIRSYLHSLDPQRKAMKVQINKNQQQLESSLRKEQRNIKNILLRKINVHYGTYGPLIANFIESKKGLTRESKQMMNSIGNCVKIKRTHSDCRRLSLSLSKGCHLLNNALHDGAKCD